MATIITSLWQLIESASVANLSTVIYSAERGYEGITVSLDEGTLARESYNIKWLQSFMISELYSSDSVSCWQYYWLICQRLDICYLWAKKHFALVWAPHGSVVVRHGPLDEFYNDLCDKFQSGSLYSRPMDICRQDKSWHTGWVKVQFPGFVNMRRNFCAPLPAAAGNF